MATANASPPVVNGQQNKVVMRWSFRICSKASSVD